MKTHCIAAVAVALLPAAAAAQTGRDSVNLEVTFTGAREMLLQDANKQSVWPEARTLTGKQPEFSYRLLPKRLNVAPAYEPVGPTRLKVDPPLPLLYGGWVRASMGTWVTPTLDAGYASRRSRDGMWGVQVQHRSTQFGLVEVDSVDTRFATSSLDVWGRAFRGKHVWDAGADAGRDAVAYYGIAALRAAEEPLAIPASERSIFLRAGGAIGWHYTPEDSLSLRPEARISYRLLASDAAVRTHTWNGTARVAARINGHDAAVDGRVIVDRRTVSEDESQRYEQALIALQPSLAKATRTWKAQAGLGVYIDARGAQVFHVYPHLQGEVPLFRGKLTPFVAWGGEVVQNRFEALLVETPFLDPNVELRSTYRPIDATGGLNGTLGRSFRYTLEAGVLRETNHLYFRNDSTSGAGERLGALYDTLGVRSFRGELVWTPSMPLEVRAGAAVFRYSTSGQLHAWNLPDFAFTGEARYTWKETLTVGLVGRIETGRMGLSERAVLGGVNDAESGGYVVDLGTLADIDLSFDYRVTGRLSAQVDFRNLLASRYRLFAAYPVQGFQAFFGATYTF